MIPLPPTSTLFPYTTLFRSPRLLLLRVSVWVDQISRFGVRGPDDRPHFAIANLIEPVRLHDVCLDRKSTRLNSSHQIISYAVFCLKKNNEAGYTMMFSTT